MQFIRFISKLIVGLIFTFSGFVKCIDPLGTAYKIEDYLTAFGMDGLHEYALTLSIIMCGLELLIGLMLIFNTKVVLASWVALIFMVFYTPLTFYLALTNPVTDCGCFGDALVLSNWQTFIKNIFILGFAIITFFHRKKYHDILNPFLGWLLFLFMVILVIGFELFSLNRLPIIDFRPYKIGVNIKEAMEVPEDAAVDEIEMILIYEKNGLKKEFTMNNLPDETWNYVERHDKVLSRGYEPPIHDFSIMNSDGWEITDDVLNGGFVGLLIAHDINLTDQANLDKINSLAGFMKVNGHRFMCLTSSSRSEVDAFVQRNSERGVDISYEFCTTDKTALKTIIRSNPGLLLIRNGIIMNKWHHKHLPSIQDLNNDIQVVEY